MCWIACDWWRMRVQYASAPSFISIISNILNRLRYCNQSKSCYCGHTAHSTISSRVSSEWKQGCAEESQHQRVRYGRELVSLEDDWNCNLGLEYVCAGTCMREARAQFVGLGVWQSHCILRDAEWRRDLQCRPTEGGIKGVGRRMQRGRTYCTPAQQETSVEKWGPSVPQDTLLTKISPTICAGC